jgi:hypothetical protein
MCCATYSAPPTPPTRAEVKLGFEGDRRDERSTAAISTVVTHHIPSGRLGKGGCRVANSGAQPAANGPSRCGKPGSDLPGGFPVAGGGQQHDRTDPVAEFGEVPCRSS